MRLNRFREIYREYPQQFWLLLAASFIDTVGGALIFPFFSLYFTQRFGVSMTQVGVVFLIFGIGSIFGNAVGGALTDKLGRKRMVIFGLVTSASSSIVLGVMEDVRLLYPLAVFVGVFATMGGPARSAMVADILPEEQRAEGYGMMRVVANLAVTFGPMIGGLLAGVSFLLLFLVDAVTSLIMAVMVALLLHETMPAPDDDKEPETLAQSFGGYGRIMRDTVFVLFILVSIMIELVYMQMNSTLVVYLHDYHDIPPQGFGLLISINAAMVVLFQFWITRRIKRRPPLLVMAAGALLYGLGFGLFGFVSVYALFIAAMVIITIGEMVIAPIGQALVAQLAPEAMRGRYMAFYVLVYIVSGGLAPVLAGVLMDNGYADWVWYLSLVLGGLGALGFMALHQRLAGTAREVKAVAEAT